MVTKRSCTMSSVSVVWQPILRAVLTSRAAKRSYSSANAVGAPAASDCARGSATGCLRRMSSSRGHEVAGFVYHPQKNQRRPSYSGAGCGKPRFQQHDQADKQRKLPRPTLDSTCPLIQPLVLFTWWAQGSTARLGVSNLGSHRIAPQLAQGAPPLGIGVALQYLQMFCCTNHCSLLMASR